MAKPALTVDSGGFDLAAFESEANKAHALYLETVALVDHNLAVGSFYNVPHPLVARNYHFVRVGLKGDPRAEEKGALLKNRFRYIDAPKEVRCAGFEADGDRTYIVCATEEHYRRMRAEKALKGHQRRERLHNSVVKDMESKLRGQFPGMDMQVNARINTGSQESFEDDLKAARNDLPRGR